MVIINNAKLHNYKELQTIIIDGEIIKEIFPSNSIKEFPKDSKVIDAKGRTVLPGMNDSHLHLINYAFTKLNLMLDKATSITEVISLGKEYLKNKPKFILGRLYNDNNLKEKRLLVKEDLDQISKDIPIIIYRVCGHIATINSKAIEILKLTPDIVVDGGALDSFNGELTGVIRENALDLTGSLFSRNFNLEDYKEMIASGIKDANKVGLTSLQSNDINNNIKRGLLISKAYSELHSEGRLNARIFQQITFDDTNMYKKFLKEEIEESSYYKIGPLKLFIDGSLGANTAALFNNYLNTNTKGILCLEEDNYEELLNISKENKKQVIVHAIGDRGISIVLDGFEKVFGKDNYNRNGVVHVQITSKELLNRFKELQVCALVQPIFINTDMFMVYNKVSEELANSSYAFNTLFKSTKTSFGSDAPVEDFNPFYGIYHAVTRKDLSGKHEYIKEEALSVEDAIKAYTVDAAYMSYEEDVKGKVETGYLADLVIIDRDIYTIPKEDIKNIEVDYTMVGGRVVYEK